MKSASTIPCSEVIRRRRSVRRYARRPVSPDELLRIIDAGMWAPSGLNNQPWKFKIITDVRQKNGLAGFTRYSAIIKSAPALLCVFLDKQAMYDRDKDIMAIGACIQNMLLQAAELGIGTCWLGEILHRKYDVAAYLCAGGGLELMAVVSIGYSQARAGGGKRKKMAAVLLP